MLKVLKIYLLQIDLSYLQIYFRPDFSEGGWLFKKNLLESRKMGRGVFVNNSGLVHNPFLQYNCFESDCQIVMMIQCGVWWWWYVLFQRYICPSVATVNTMGRYPCMGSLSICFHRCEHGSTRVIKQVQLPRHDKHVAGIGSHFRFRATHLSSPLMSPNYRS